MNSPANDNAIKTAERKIHILTHSIAKVDGELDHAEGPRKRALVKLIRMGRRRIEELRTLH
jgi:hypothetical protein